MAHAGQSQASTATDTPASAARISDSVTLITGDKVSLDAAGHVVRVAAAKGRAGMNFQVQQTHGHTYVMPWDAEALVSRGTLDRRLFDVGELVADGYSDARRADLPLMVSYAAAERSAARPLVLSQARAGRSLPSIGGDVLYARKAGGSALWDTLTERGGASAARGAAPGIAHVWLNSKIRVALDRSVPQIGAPAAWKAGYDGKGVKVAVLDTGVDDTHPDLKDRVVAEKNFSDSKDTVDRFGHGTHVASIVAGSGAKSGGRYKGVAPGADLLIGKVLSDDGAGDYASIIAGMQWAVGEGARVVNTSLGQDDSPGIDPVEEAVNTLSEQSGTLFVVAAGNSGPGEGTIGTPGSAQAALTVGAVDKQDVIASFSSRGPTADGDLKPDITAPGVDIVAAKAAQGVIGTPVADGYVSLSGTSMATPHVAGAAALLAEQHPDWTGARIKAQLTASAKAAPDLSAFVQGTGRVDVSRALDQNITTGPTSLGFGIQRYPHTDDQPVTKQVMYHNSGDTPVTLDLSVEAFGSDGKPAAAGMFTVSPARLTVPAGGEASTSVTVDTRAGSADGTFGGSLVATSADGNTSVRTAVGVQREVPSFNLTLRHLDLKGRTAKDAMTYVYGLDNSLLDSVSGSDAGADGTVTIRLPKGRYGLQSQIGADRKNILLQPELTLDHDTTVDLDARRTHPVDITVPDKAAKNNDAVIFYRNTAGTVPQHTTFGYDDYRGVRVGMLGKPVPAAKATAYYTGTWTDSSRKGHPVNYRLGWPRTGDLSGFTAHLTARQLVRVPVTIGSPAPGKKATVSVSPLLPDGNWYDGAPDDVKLPETATDYFLPNDLKWHYTVYQTTGDASETTEAEFESKPLSFAAHRNHSLRFDVGVFGPSLPSGSPWPGAGQHVGAGATRAGDTLRAYLPLFGDAADHLGTSEYTKARSTLSADGRQTFATDTPLVGSAYALPAKSALYHLTTDVTRARGVSAVSTRVTAEWTFHSAHVDGDTSVRLPLSVVRFSPQLAADSSAKAGRVFTVPFTVQGAATARTLGQLDFHVSYDHGRTWHTVKYRNGALTLRHPAAAGTVSLRAHLVDAHGNTLTQTIHDAYRTTK
ncbi:Subtilase family protein [Streptomyces sp. OV198]|uniref:S8 family peptidase n=1 Tax=Streptomyces sp. OV198 TaxID=1882787 RepID=UPI000BCD59AF|nr:S8 family serine peptidase [Streptomyces sp. OV198]SOF02250.1 Subtilase family protein [Streptomyces sp. OV198]